MQLAESERARLCKAAAVARDEHRPVRGGRSGLRWERGVAAHVDERDRP